MIGVEKRQRSIIGLEFYGLRIHLWITILVICCDLTTVCYGSNIEEAVIGTNGIIIGEAVIAENGNIIGEDIIRHRCRNAELYRQTSWKLYESCCQELYPEQTCPLACPCRHGSVCLPSLNQCLCKPGYTGHRCEETCRVFSNDTWGVGCSKTCRCGPDADCDPFMGTCTCRDENRCGERCKRFRYGPKCERKCRSCQRLGLDCDASTGTCARPSIIRDTSKRCGCKNGGRCLSTGKCECYWGYHGAFCHITCPHGYYGKNCDLACKCGKKALCTPDDGSCRCRADMGYDCPGRCPPDTYGPRCEYKCRCPVGMECEQKTGDCYQIQRADDKKTDTKFAFRVLDEVLSTRQRPALESPHIDTPPLVLNKLKTTPSKRMTTVTPTPMGYSR